MPQQIRTPDIEAQRAAMRKLGFLAGKWAGEARILRGPNETVELSQTEEASYKLDGLLLTIEGVGRGKADGQIVLQALGMVSYDDEARVYRMRAYNDGRWLETEMVLKDRAKEIRWGFALGEIRTSSVLRIDERGDWTELADITVGSAPPRKFLELRVSPQK